MKGKLIITLVVLLALPLSVQAYTLTSETINGTVVEGETLHYRVTITNDKIFNDTVWFSQFIDERLFDLTYALDRVTLTPGENRTIDIFVDSTLDTPLLIEVPFRFYFSNPANENNEVTFKGKFLKAGDVRPMILDYSFPSGFDPRYAQTLIVYVYNPSGTFINSLVKYEIRKDDELLFNDSTTSMLEPLTSTQVSFNVQMVYDQPVGDYVLRFRAYNKDYAYEWNETTFTITGYAEYHISEPLIEKVFFGFFGKTLRLNLTNTGTGTGTHSVKLKMAPVDRFMAYEKEGNITFVGGQAVFTAILTPGETKEFVYKITYLPLILLPIFLVVVYYFYAFFTRKAKVSRKVVPIHIGEHSSSFKVTMRIRNLSKDKLKSVRVREVMLPFIKKIGSYGTLHPKIIKDLTGKKLLWNVGEMSPRSEVIITYQFHTSLGILGKIFIPGTKLEYKHKGIVKTARGGVSVFSTSK
jgi:hypothetical protein